MAMFETTCSLACNYDDVIIRICLGVCLYNVPHGDSNFTERVRSFCRYMWKIFEFSLRCNFVRIYYFQTAGCG